MVIGYKKGISVVNRDTKGKDLRYQFFTIFHKGVGSLFNVSAVWVPHQKFMSALKELK